ncbi:hypothetical protein [Lacipirellula parvula]|uniref:Uncharacterized protein n=1 Tax=Lacipirellula parvula TaxID=2650471 RepID=A0A5K7X8C0_9BACT|nr:hypothetical protein [Lacipirellula parvula]BBO32880.1 hypothetical protein PLANPX_2492 [Lacipirellula parvula]
MTPSPHQLSSVRWPAIFPWLILVRAARVSLMFRVIVLALLGVAATHGGWRLIDSMLQGSQSLESLERAPQISIPLMPERHEPPTTFNEPIIVKSELTVGAFLSAWHWLGRPFGLLALRPTLQESVTLALAGVWSVAVWALFGGAIARIAAVYLTYGETLGPIAAIRAAARTWLAAVGAIGLVALATLVVALPLIVAGALLRFDLMVLLMGMAWIVALLCGAVVAILAVGLALGWPLMWATSAVERTDAFDAISRGFAYLYQRPLQLLFYVLVASLIGVLAQLAVSAAVVATTTATEWSVALGAGEGRTSDLGFDQQGVSGDVDSVGEIGAGGIQFWTGVVQGASTYFPLAYFWPAVTAIYLLLRREIDGTEMTEVVFDEGESFRGLKPLTPTASGVPQIEGSGSEQATTSK